ncbi:MAG: hypothetical protein CVT80_11140 [Alphaproteobacteria bacterium HGW-Alphaproteobacteria-2]|nr:MAG: hypothetical protein CVT80_11140 [Alphaproteobacteria bacterium HGW-Alphaproteobacteria-2]
MPDPQIASLPEPPYYAVIFTSRRRGADAGYDAMADEMARLAAIQPGYLGHESARDAAGFGITVSYWRDAAAIRAWKAEVRHLAAQRLGHARWYADYAVRVARVGRAYHRENSAISAP